MGKYFNFDALIKKYESEFTVITAITAGTETINDMGDYEYSEPTETAKRGAIIGISDNKIYRSEGMLTSKDKELYMRESLGCNYDKAHVIFKGNKYKVEQMPDENADFSGVFSYILKYVSAFGGGGAA
jgi:hypothetical protein